MSADPNKKSARTFQCRDVLWETFEQMARELECSIDYLINESMKQYARQRSYSPRTPFPGPARPDGSPNSGQMGTGQGPATSVTPPPMGRGRARIGLGAAVAADRLQPRRPSPDAADAADPRRGPAAASAGVPRWAGWWPPAAAADARWPARRPPPMMGGSGSATPPRR